MFKKTFPKLFFILLIIYPSLAMAATDNFNDYLGEIYTWSITIGGALAVFTIIWAGFDYAISQGDVEKINTAKEKLAGAFLGLLLLVLTYLIVATLHTGITTTSTTTSKPAINSSGTEGGVVAPQPKTSESPENPNPQTLPPFNPPT